MKRAVLYARVSGDDRERESLPAQLRLCRERAEQRGWSVVAELAEDERGVSGAALDAPQLQRAVEMASAGEYDVLVVREMDRLARSLPKQIITEDALARAGVVIHYVLGEYADTPEGQLQKNVRAVIAEYERLKIAERVQRGLKESVRRGNVVCAGRPPFGYRQDDDGDKRVFVVHADEAAVVQQIFDWYCYGDEERPRLGIAAVAAKLTERGIPTPGQRRPVRHSHTITPSRWSTTTVHEILLNATYTGIWTYNATDGSEIAVPVPAIIDESQYVLAQRRRRENTSFAKRNLRHEYLLRQRVRCGACGYRMISQVSANPRRVLTYLYYVCPARYKPKPRGRCAMRFIRADALDAGVWGLVVRLFSNPDALREAWETWRVEGDEAAPTRRELEFIEAEVERLAARLERLLNVYLDGSTTLALFRQHRDELESRLAELRERRLALMDELEALDDQAAFETLEQFAAAVGDEIAATTEYEERMWYAEALDLQVVIGLDRIAYVSAQGVELGRFGPL